MNVIVPWAHLCEVIEPCYPKVRGGRATIGLERILSEAVTKFGTPA